MQATPLQRFSGRAEAGGFLASLLSSYAGKTDTLVLALPRGGVPVAREVAKALSLPLDIWLVRKLGIPGHEETAMGAIALGDIIVRNEDLMGLLHIPPESFQDVIAKEKRELDRRNTLYRQGRPVPDVNGKTVIIIDDGFATGATMRAAIASLRQAGAVWIIAAAPVGSDSACDDLSKEADDVICPLQPEPFYGVGQWYEDFSQTSDGEVLSILAENRAAHKRGAQHASR